MTDTKNVFQIWDEIGRILPFAVRRANWGERYYAVVEEVEIIKWPYGTARGYATDDGIPSDHFAYNSSWRKDRIFPNAGSYQWYYVENPCGFEKLKTFNSREGFDKWFSEGEVNQAFNKGVINDWEKTFYLNVHEKSYLTDKQLAHKYRINILLHGFNSC